MNNKKTEVSIAIERIVKDNIGTSYIEACLQYAEENDLEIKEVSKLINPTLKEKLYNESLKNNLIRTVKKSSASLNDFIK